MKISRKLLSALVFLSTSAFSHFNLFATFFYFTLVNTSSMITNETLRLFIDSFEFQILFRGIFFFVFCLFIFKLYAIYKKKKKTTHFIQLLPLFVLLSKNEEESFNSFIESGIIQHQLTRKMLQIDFLNRNNCRQP